MNEIKDLHWFDVCYVMLSSLPKNTDCAPQIPVSMRELFLGAATFKLACSLGERAAVSSLKYWKISTGDQLMCFHQSSRS